MSTRLAGAVLVSALLIGCGVGSAGRVDAELVAFANLGAGTTEQISAIIRTPAQAAAFAERFEAEHPGGVRRLEADMLAARPSRSRVLLGFTGLGCAEDGARLRRDGTSFSAEFTGGEGTLCAAASQLVAVFAVDAEDLPPDFTLS